MARFETEDMKQLKYLIVAMLIINCLGCSTMSINKQKKLTLALYDDALLIKPAAKKMCDDGTISTENCERIGKLFDLFVDSIAMYASAIDTYEKAPDSPTHLSRLNAARSRSQDAFAKLIIEAANLGINWRKKK